MNFKIYHGYTVYENGTIISKRLGKPLKPCLNKDGYLHVILMINGKRINKKVHRIVAEVFLPNYYGLPTVDHKDKNRLNNSLYNLKWKDHRGQQINTGMYSTNTSGIKGVCFYKRDGTWNASISTKANKRTRKSFHTKEEAIAQRLEWEKEYY